MKRLRRRFVLGSLLSLSVILTILLFCFWAAGVVQMEKRADAILDALLEDGAELPDAPIPPLLDVGYAVPSQFYPACYVRNIHPDGTLLDSAAVGLWGKDTDTTEQVVTRILETGSEAGKMQEYRYAVRRLEDGGSRVVLLDQSVQIRTLYDMFLGGLKVSLYGLLGALIVLIPVSGRVVRSYTQNAERQKRFMTNAEHEIKTPVAIIQANLDAMELIQGENKWSRNIRSQTGRLRALIDQLTLVSKLDETDGRLPKDLIDLSALVSRACASDQERFAQRGIRLTAEITPELGMMGNEECIRQLVHILLDNAAAYALQGSWLSIGLEQRGKWIVLRAKNPVSALPACPPSMLFERFYRADEARTQKDGGSGIGLSAAREIVRLHGGKLSAVYGKDQTIEFIAELPQQ